MKYEEIVIGKSYIVQLVTYPDIGAVSPYLGLRGQIVKVLEFDEFNQDPKKRVRIEVGGIETYIEISYLKEIDQHIAEEVHKQLKPKSLRDIKALTLEHGLGYAIDNYKMTETFQDNDVRIMWDYCKVLMNNIQKILDKGEC